jgi:VanZ family protein
VTDGQPAGDVPMGSATAPASRERLARRLTLVWAGVVLVFALLPLHGALSATVGERETLTTQVGHFVEFAILAGLGSWWARERGALTSARAATAGFAAAAALGAAIEVVQYPLPYRSAQMSDLALDAVGALVGALVVSAGWSLRARGGRRRAR